MSVVSNNILAGASGQGGGGYQIERSLRFNPGDSAYLNRTPSSSGNLKTWTWSGWVKRSNSGAGHTNDFFSCGVNIHNGGAGGAQANAYFDVDGTIQVYEYSGGYGYNYRTTQVFRDFSAWYHIVISLDTTDLTAGDRVKIYINGDRVTSFSTSNAPTLNFEGEINKSGVQHYISDTAAPFNGYLADVHFIDGQALAPTDFGETDDNGVWQPKKFAGGAVNQVITGGSYSTSGLYAGSYTPSDSIFHDSDANTGVGVDSATLAYLINDLGSSKLVTKITVGFGDNGVANTGWTNGYITGAIIAGSNDNSSWTTIGTCVGTNDDQSFDVNASYRYIRISMSNNYLGVGKFVIYEQGAIPSNIYGTNGFHLDFADNSSNAALGTDTSGNNNNFTVNNLAAQTAIAANYYNMLNVTPNTGNAFIASNVTPYINTSTWAITNTHWVGMSYYSGTGAMTFTPTTSIPVTNSLIVYFGAWADSGYTATLTITYTDSTTETGSFTSSSSNYMGVKTASNASGKSIQSISVITSSSLGYHSIGGIVVDGVLLTNVDGAITDSLRDTPTNGTQTDTGAGGEITGCYATWNPLDKASNSVLTNGNLDNALTGAGISKATIHVSSGKWYWEISKTDAVNNVCGIATSGAVPSATYLGGVAGTAGFTGQGLFSFQSPFGRAAASNVGAMSNGDILGFALDCDNGTLKLYINNVLQTADHFTFTPGLSVTPAMGSNVARAAYPTNFGQHAFAYAAPSGYKCLNTANLPDPTIADGSLYFDTKLYTGNDNTQTISGMSLRPDLLWLRSRAQATNHEIFDVVRGNNKVLFPNLTNAEITDSNRVTSFNSDGFGLGPNSNANVSGGAVAWAWDAGDLATTSDTTNYNQSQTWSSGTTTGTWDSSFPLTQLFNGSLNDGIQASNSGAATLAFSNITAQTSIEVYGFNTTTGTDEWQVTANGTDYVVALPANPGGWVTVSASYPASLDEVSNLVYRGRLNGIKVDGKLLIDPGVIAAGGLNSSVYDQSQTWSTAGTITGSGYSSAYTYTKVFNGGSLTSLADSAFAITNSSYKYTFAGSGVNVSNNVKVYYWQNGGTLKVNAGESDEQSITASTSSYTSTTYNSSTIGVLKNVQIETTATDHGPYLIAIEVDGKILVDSGVTPLNVPSIASTVRASASSGCSIVSFTNGNGTVGHGLSAPPGLIITKQRDASYTWSCYHSSLGKDKYIALNYSNAAGAVGGMWGSAEPTSSVFGTTFYVAPVGADMIAYCFAPVEGYSAMGSYTGNGSTDGVFIYTGFTPSWLLFKRHDAGSDWTIYDTARDSYNASGIRLRPNLSNADHDERPTLDILSNGFKFRRNSYENGGNDQYIYMAFASHPFKTARAR